MPCHRFLALSPHRKKVMGLNPGSDAASLWGICFDFPPTIKKNVHRVNSLVNIPDQVSGFRSGGSWSPDAVQWPPV